MTLTPRVFKLRKIALLGKSLIGKVTVLILTAGIYLLINRFWIEAAAALILSLVLFIILNYSHRGYSFYVTPEGLRFDNIEIKWEDVKTVKFTVDSGGGYGLKQFSLSPVVPKIKLETENGQFTIYTRNYIAGKLLRDTLEEACREKSVKCIVEDRGAY